MGPLTQQGILNWTLQQWLQLKPIPVPVLLEMRPTQWDTYSYGLGPETSTIRHLYLCSRTSHSVTQWLRHLYLCFLKPETCQVSILPVLQTHTFRQLYLCSKNLRPTQLLNKTPKTWYSHTKISVPALPDTTDPYTETPVPVHPEPHTHTIKYNYCPPKHPKPPHWDTCICTPRTPHPHNKIQLLPSQTPQIHTLRHLYLYTHNPTIKYNYCPPRHLKPPHSDTCICTPRTQHPHNKLQLLPSQAPQLHTLRHLYLYTNNPTPTQ